MKSEPITKHTPGPWDIKFQENNENWLVMHGLDAVAECPDWNGMPGNANARLIAAAPELLEAAKSYLAVIHGDNSPEAIALRAAISKAEGR